MSNQRRRKGNVPKVGEAAVNAFLRPGADPFPVKIVAGELTFDTETNGGGYAFSRVVTAGAGGDPEPVDASGNVTTKVKAIATNAAVRPLLVNSEWTNRFSACVLYLEFTNVADDADTSGCTADVHFYRLTDKGDLILDGSVIGVADRVFVRDDDVQGMPTYYRVTNVVLGAGPPAATSVNLHVAGEGLGYAASEGP